jgi:hypothetical protein
MVNQRQRFRQGTSVKSGHWGLSSREAVPGWGDEPFVQRKRVQKPGEMNDINQPLCLDLTQACALFQREITETQAGAAATSRRLSSSSARQWRFAPGDGSWYPACNQKAGV